MSDRTVLDRHATALLLGGMGLALLPHLGRLPLWFSALLVGVGAWRFGATARGWRAPGLVWRVAIVGTAIFGIHQQFGTLVGRDAGVALLVVMMILKLLELRQRRDVMVLILLSYFALSTHFLYDQSIGLALYVGLATAAILTLHIHLTQRPEGRLRQSAGPALRLLLQALPLALVLFLLFPRIPGPIWGLPQEALSNMTGLSDQMTPGSITNLGRSDEIAFRVAFEGAVPAPQLRYWRGPVLWDTDGRGWRNLDGGRLFDGATVLEPRLVEAADPVDYTVTLEPSNKRWLLTLDIATVAPDIGRLTPDFYAIAPQPLRERVRYRVRSHTRYNTGPPTFYQIQRGLRLPAGRNPRAVALGRSLRQRFDDEGAIVEALLKHFREQPFVYTLSPPLLDGPDPVDRFLFESREGFCEHYAAAFVTVMRAAGVPARVVTGYQGGELNPVGDYLIVRQRDAHAWAEVWLRGRGWVRVDPTAAVAPERVEQGLAEGEAGERGAIRFSGTERDVVGRWLRQLRFGADSLNNAWNQWVLGFDREAQRKLLERLGLRVSHWRDLLAPLAAAVALVLLVSALFILRRERGPGPDPAAAAYARFCHKMARRGLVRRPDESPGDFARRVAAAEPELKREVERITALYQACRYGARPGPESLRRLREAVRRLR